MAAVKGISSPGFVPPYFFDHLSKVDFINARAWQSCRDQSIKIFKSRAQEFQNPFTASLSNYSTPLSSGQSRSAQVNVTSLSSTAPLSSRQFGRVSVITPPDLDVINAEKNGKMVLKFLRRKLDRSSFDGKGSELKIYVHSKDYPNNAYWINGAVYIGDSSIAGHQSLTEDIDIMAHEVGHGVVSYTAKLQYENQSGALNESWADVFGSMVKQYSLKQTSGGADWLIGDKYVEDLPGAIQALRSMKNPGTAYRLTDTEKDPQVDHMDKFGKVDLSKYDDRDNGGVHIYSGIPNKAFYNFAMAFPELNSWEIAGKVWYQALLSPIDSKATFQQFAEATVKAVDMVEDFPDTVSVKDIAAKLEKAWGKVGIEFEKPSEKVRDIQVARPPQFLPVLGSGISMGRPPMILDTRLETHERRRRRHRSHRRDDSCGCAIL